MLISQEAQGERPRRQGGTGAGLAELRRQLADPSSLDEGNRQRLLELARRAARVQALGDEYGRVELSEQAAAAVLPVVALA